MNEEFRKRARRLFAVGLLGLLCATLWVGMMEPVVDYLHSAAVSRGISLRALKRDRALLRQADAIAEARKTVEQSARWRNFYEGLKPESATLQLESDVQAILRESNGITSLVAEPAVRRGPVTRVAVRVSLSLRVDQLAEALDRIQKNVRQLRVESLIVQAPEVQAAQTNPSVMVQLEVSALMLPQAVVSGAST